MAINNTITAHRVPAMTVVIIRWQTRSCPDARSHLNGQFSFVVFSVVGLMVGFYLRVRVRIPQALIDAMSNDQTGQCYLPLNEGKSYCLRRHEASSATTGRYCRFHQEFFLWSNALRCTSTGGGAQRAVYLRNAHYRF